MLLELAEGTLRQRLKKHLEDLTWKDKYKLALDIVNGIIHKDLVRIAD